MATVWLIGVEGGLQPALEAAGHSVRAFADGSKLPASDAPDVMMLRHPSAPLLPLRQAAAAHPTAACVAIVGAEQAGHGAALIDAGAADVWVEPVQPQAALIAIARVLRDGRARARMEHPRSPAAQLEEVIGDHPAMRELLERISRIARRSALGPGLSVLLTGETGTGKGLLARALHYSSRRRDGPFVEVNCAALPSGLIEAELFGYERGAFTDAKTARVGLIEAAEGGTLLLDEVSCLPLDAQAKLLTVLESRNVRRLGSTTERRVDVQVVAATSEDVSALSSQGKFRPELMHRLAALWFKLPPLRERGADAERLAAVFAARACEAYQLPPKKLGPEALRAIRAHDWPGNVRELKHAVERAILGGSEGEEIRVEELGLGEGTAQVVAGSSGSLRVSLPAGGISLDAIEKAAIEEALKATSGNVTRAAALLQITRDTLRSRMEKHGLARG